MFSSRNKKDISIFRIKKRLICCYETAQMQRLIWVFTVVICPITCFRMAWPLCSLIGLDISSQLSPYVDDSNEVPDTTDLYHSLRILWANSADNKLMIFFFIFPENRIRHFMQIISSGGNLQEMSNLVFWEK